MSTITLMGGPGSGSKPKVYPSELVDLVRAEYGKGRTQEEVALAVGVSQKVIWRLMARHGIAARVAAKREQRGANNSCWKGDSAKYAALHLRVASARGTPSKCGHCGTESGCFDWASVTRHYQDVNDYIRLCRSCHNKFDGKVRNLGAYAKRKGDIQR